MEQLNLKKYQYIIGTSLLLIGILAFVLCSGPILFVGIGFIILAYVYFGIMVYLKLSHKNKGQTRSRIRDQMMKYYFRK